MEIPELNDPMLNGPYSSGEGRKRARRLRRAIRAAGCCRCYICFKALKVSDITLDHEVPFSQGGRGRKNLRICCNRCNQFRATMPINYYRMLRGFVLFFPQRLELKQYAQGFRLTRVLVEASSKI